MKGKLDAFLPLTLPQPCPICNAKVVLTAVTEWESETGKAVTVEYECETEPNIDSKEWRGWHRGHYRMPYVDWLPWELQMLKWLNANYEYRRG